MCSVRKRTEGRAAGKANDEGVTLVEVLIAFVVLMITLIPLSYLFTASIIQAGQSTNQQTALSIAEQWVETLSNWSPPVNSNGEVIVNQDAAPTGPAANTATVNGAYTVPSNLATPTSMNINTPNNLALASTTNPQALTVTTSAGADSINYTGQTVNGSSQITSITGITGWSQQETIASGAAVTQSAVLVPTVSKGNTTYSLQAEYEWTAVQGGANGSQPNLCIAGTPQLLRVRVSVAWGPTTDSNNVQDSVVVDYPPSGIQTLGFIALQVNGDSTAIDSQANPWSERVQAPPVTLAGAQSLTIYPDTNGCAFAQVKPGSYTVTINNATSGELGGAPNSVTYGSPSFVENATGTVIGNVLQQPQSVPFGASVQVGAVTRLTTAYDQGSIVGLSYPSSTATEDGVTCPGVTGIACIAYGETSTGTFPGVNATAALSDLTTPTSQWSTVSLPSGVTRITSVACANRCIGVGYGPGGAVIVSSPTAATSVTIDTPIPTGLASLSQILCPSLLQCVAIGTTTTGAAAVVSGLISTSSDSWTSDAISATPTTATIAGLTNLICPSGSGGCMATGISTSPSAGTPVVVSGGFALGWTASSPNPTGVTLTSLTAAACPTTTTSTTCLLTGATSTGPEVVSGTAALGLGVAAPSWIWSADTFQGGTTVTSLNGLACPTTTKCLLMGRSSTTPLVLNGAITPAAVFAPDSLPASVATLTQMTCPTTGACVLIGATSTPSPAIVSGTIGSSDTWASATVPSPGSGETINQLTSVTCWSNPSCAITAVGTNAAGLPMAFLLASSGGTTSWSSPSLPTGNPALYIGGVSCVATGTTTCTAVGASATGTVELVSTAGTTGTWSDQTANGMTGLPTTGIPVEINNANLQPSPYQTFITPGWSTPPAQPFFPLYPFTSGYNVFAGDCSAESITGLNVAQAPTIPGGSSSTTVPLGLLSVQVLHSSGNSVGLPYAATLSLLATTSGCGPDTYPLQPAGVDGLSRTEVPYGTYTLTITTAGGTTTVTNVTVGGSSVSIGATGYPLPTPISEKVT